MVNTTIDDKIIRLKALQKLEKDLEMLESNRFTSLHALFYYLQNDISDITKKEVLAILIKDLKTGIEELMKETG
jgi:predicted transcriptional regulator